MCQEFGYGIVPGEHKKLERIGIKKAIAKFEKNKLYNERDSAIVAILGAVNRKDQENANFFLA